MPARSKNRVAGGGKFHAASEACWSFRCCLSRTELLASGAWVCGQNIRTAACLDLGTPVRLCCLGLSLTPDQFSALPGAALPQVQPRKQSDNIDVFPLGLLKPFELFGVVDIIHAREAFNILDFLPDVTCRLQMQNLNSSTADAQQPQDKWVQIW